MLHSAVIRRTTLLCRQGCCDGKRVGSSVHSLPCTRARSCSNCRPVWSLLMTVPLLLRLICSCRPAVLPSDASAPHAAQSNTSSDDLHLQQTCSWMRVVISGQFARVHHGMIDEASSHLSLKLSSSAKALYLPMQVRHVVALAIQSLLLCFGTKCRGDELLWDL